MEDTYQELNEKYKTQLISDLKLNGFQKDWKKDKWSLFEEYINEETFESKFLYYIVDLNPKTTFPFRVEFTYIFLVIKHHIYYRYLLLMNLKFQLILYLTN